MKNNKSVNDIIKTEHIGEWVAMSRDYKKVLGHSSSLIQLQKQVGKEVVYVKPLPNNSIFSFSPSVLCRG